MLTSLNAPKIVVITYSRLPDDYVTVLRGSLVKYEASSFETPLARVGWNGSESCDDVLNSSFSERR
ncbi:hypothetical protein MUK42_21983 [Musa troglodytarum]|uniref:Uncharacterized protein n=1 Tax=Musa troglodytarum TaxID=320322 RepID=A0A9E7LF05_9LILI|nr:hypothetical protein MUK42_21983 [Musa troglodytarum]